LLRQRVDAIVLIVVDIAVLEALRSLEIGIPLVAAAATQRRSPHLVSIDQYRGARSAVRHLVELGHSRILHLAGPPSAPDAIERIRGWRDELAASRLEVVEPRHGDWSAASGYELGRTIDATPGTGLFVGNDQMAIGVLSALRERGLRVPADVSVVGFDDVPEAAYLLPSLTTVRQDFAALGGLIMQKVLVAVEEPENVAEDTPLATRLVIRDSTGPAPRSD
ncbi:MAG: substrate-binding domain-containing protein, partial [Microbacterium sp.]|nr:substrate-binding domain-containing protein [Microbacterium sp.]